MRALRIEGTDKTPQVILDPDKNVFELKGKSIPTDAEAFFGPVLEWFDEFAKRPKIQNYVGLYARLLQHFLFQKTFVYAL